MSVYGFEDEHVHADGSTAYRPNCPDCHGDRRVRDRAIVFPSDKLMGPDDGGCVTLEEYRAREARRDHPEQVAV